MSNYESFDTLFQCFMMHESRASDIFCEVYSLSPEQRSGRIRELTEGDIELENLVYGLFSAFERNPNFLEPEVVLEESMDDSTRTLSPGTQIGPYRVVRLIARGGMGQVFLVEQKSPIQRLLALKLIDSPDASAATTLRFELERQTLAILNHPYIAKVIDGGTLPNKTPFLVMEYVEGEPLGSFIASHSVDVMERIRLFLKICDAVRHAHQKGVIHRDLKPSNIIVQLLDDHLVPKVIDFGLAKWLLPQESGITIDSGPLRVLGTLPYICPELLQNEIPEVDIRSDVYALGMLFYFMMTGQNPFQSASDSKNVTDLELIRRIREDDPERPSVYLSKNISQPNTAKFHLEFRQLPGTLAEDIDWITIKALEKNLHRRYESVAELVADVRNALNSQPILAGPPDLKYKALKYARRNWISLFLGAAASVACAGLVVGYFQARSAQKSAYERLQQSILATQAMQQAREEANQSNIDLRKALNDSEQHRREAESISGFLEEVFARPRPGKSGSDLKVADVLVDASKTIQANPSIPPIAKASLLHTMGNTLRALGLDGQAIKPLTEALQMRDELLGKTSPETISTAAQLGRTYTSLKRDQDAIRIYEDRLAALRTDPSADLDAQVTMMNNLAVSYDHLGQMDLSEKLRLEMQQILPKLPEGTLTIALIERNVALLHLKKGDYPKAAEFFEKAVLRLEKNLGQNSPQTLSVRNFLILALLHFDQDRARQQLDLNEAGIRQRYKPSHKRFTDLLRAVAANFEKLGDQAQARRIFDELDQIKRDVKTQDPMDQSEQEVSRGQ